MFLVYDPWDIALLPAFTSMVFFHSRVSNWYRSAFWKTRRHLTPQYHHQHYLRYMLSCIHHIVNSIPLMNCPLIYYIMWYIFLPPQIWWFHVPCFLWVPHWWCDFMVESPLRNWFTIVLGILDSIQLAYLYPPFNWYPLRRQVAILCIWVIQWCVEQYIDSHEYLSLFRVA